MIPSSKYHHETVMRQALIAAGIASSSSRLGSKLLPGWWVDRAPKKRRG